MGKQSQKTSQAEIQRRQNQSLWDRELQRRREQSTRDRERHRRQQQSLRNRGDRISIPHTKDHTLYLAATVPPEVMAPNPVSDAERAFTSLFYNTKYSDATIYLGKSKLAFPAHRLVLGIRSPYFDDALNSGFKEGIAHEFSFEADSPHALWRVLQYMYTGTYSDDPSESLDSEGDDMELLKHPRVYALADMFRMESLKDLSCKKFDLQLQEHWKSDTFADCIREVYLTSAEIDRHATRKLVVKTAVQHGKELAQKRLFQDVVRELGDFAVDLVSAMAIGSRSGFM